MKCNIGKTDRMIRIILGLLILALGAAFQALWGILGAIPLLTAILRWCPLYEPLKINTNRHNKAV